MSSTSLFPDKNAVHEPATENLAAAWEELRLELSHLVRALGVGSANADDILQEVYVTAREKCPRALEFEDLRKWLIRVTVNRCRLEHRRTGRWRRAFIALTHLFERRAPNATAAESLSRDAQRQQVRQALQSLDADTRSLLVLRYFADFDSSEIGLIMQLPDATVRGRLRHARQKLADRLRQTGYRHEE
ncbi:MAG: sigma-70 family RNA polymerase sigma factor [Thermoguttaceae bacterium]|jgi:RNA polymerase sigma-70 factor (ECF subfamily)